MLHPWYGVLFFSIKCRMSIIFHLHLPKIHQQQPPRSPHTQPNPADLHKKQKPTPYLEQPQLPVVFEGLWLPNLSNAHLRSGELFHLLHWFCFACPGDLEELWSTTSSSLEILDIQKKKHSDLSLGLRAVGIVILIGMVHDCEPAKFLVEIRSTRHPLPALPQFLPVKSSVSKVQKGTRQGKAS